MTNNRSNSLPDDVANGLDLCNTYCDVPTIGDAELGDALRALGEITNTISHDKGFYWMGTRPMYMDAALILTEVGELVDADRAVYDKVNPDNDDEQRRIACGEELGDILIRTLETAHEKGYDIGEIVLPIS